MAVIFSNYAGQSVGINVPTAAPGLYTITSASRAAGDTSPLWAGIKAASDELLKGTSDVVDKLVDNLELTGVALFDGVIKGKLKSFVKKLKGPTSKQFEAFGFSAAVREKVKDAEKLVSDLKDERPSEASYFAIKKGEDRSFSSLKDSIGDLGYIVSIEGTYDEKIDYNVEIVTAVSKFKLGRYVIRGVCFAGSRSKDKAGRIRHGIEGILNYYGFTRLSNNKNATGLTVITLRIGNTTIEKAYVVGLDFQPAEPTSRVWSWAIVLAVQANILSAKLPASANCAPST